MAGEINYWAVLVSALVFYAIGAVWYSPLLFAKAWQKATGVTQEKMASVNKGKMALTFISTFILSLLMACVTAHLSIRVESHTLHSGIMLGFWIWLGYVAVSMGINYLYEGKSFKLFCINAGYFFIGLLKMGAIMALWQ